MLVIVDKSWDCKINSLFVLIMAFLLTFCCYMLSKK